VSLGRLIGRDNELDEALADGFIVGVRDLMTKIDIPFHLAALEENDIPGIARQALAEAHLNDPVPRYMRQQECEELLRQILGRRSHAAPASKR
jgi:alcohol dehydrogenase class IV